MRTNPFTDGLFFLTEGYWATPAFWVLLIASLVIAVAGVPAFARAENGRPSGAICRARGSRPDVVATVALEGPAGF